MKAAARAAAAVLAGTLAGCAVLPDAVIAVGGATGDTTARMAVDTRHPVLVHAVDGASLGVQVSNALRPVTYQLAPGPHVLWVSSAPAGVPFLPQRIHCFVLEANFAPGWDYTLHFDTAAREPVLRSPRAPGAGVRGRLVDAPLVMERRCKWDGA